MRYNRFCNIIDARTFIVAYDNLNKNLKRYIKSLNERITIDDFVLNMKNAFRFYVVSNHQNEREQVYQRDVRNIERRLLIQSFINQQQQQSRSQYIDQQYQQRSDQSQYQQQQYIDQQQRISYNNNQTNRKYRFQSSRVQKFFRFLFQQRFQLYSISIFDQKLLINQVNHFYYVFVIVENDVANYQNVENDFMKSNNNNNADIKYFIVSQINFEKITQTFNVETFNNENFNDEIYTRHNIIFMSCNICKISYINHDDLSYLNNHMFDIHNVKICSQ